MYAIRSYYDEQRFQLVDPLGPEQALAARIGFPEGEVFTPTPLFVSIDGADNSREANG